MGHIIFVIMHIMAILFGFVFLFLTIPLHLIFCVIEGNNNNSEVMIKKCKYCQELVHRDASLCKHCNKELPKYIEPEKTKEELEAEINILRGI